LALRDSRFGALFEGISLDIDALIATTSKTFHLADVVAANVTASTLKMYLDRASHFFSVLMEKPHKFPWDYLKVLEAGDPELAKDVGFHFDRLNSAFDARHKIVHETNILERADHQAEMSDADVLGAVGDALFLITQFQRQFEHLVMAPKFAIIKDDESLDTAATRNLVEIGAAFARMKATCHDMQFDSLERFKKAFVDYLWARSEFYASIFLPQLRHEVAVSEFLDLAPEYRQTLMISSKGRNTDVLSGRLKNSTLNLGPLEDLS
jgi:hypothetical protein